VPVFESVIRWLHVSGAKVHGAKKSQTKPGNQLWGLWVLARMMRVPRARRRVGKAGEGERNIYGRI
jgi:hypothetical protein